MTPESIGEQAALVLFDRDRMWRQAMGEDSPGGREITTGEALLLWKHERETLNPPIVDLIQAAEVVRSIYSTQRGVCGQRTIRRIKSIWHMQFGRNGTRPDHEPIPA